MYLFIISVLISLPILFGKLYFYLLEPDFALTAIARLEIFTLFFLLFLSTYLLFREKRGKNTMEKTIKLINKNNNQSFVVILLSLLIAISIVLSFWLNATKKSIHWDAVALYDARAKFLSGGMQFSEMPVLAKYDNLNKYYYLLYPPFTSVAHYAWKELELTRSYSVSIFYSIVFVFFLLIIYLGTKSKLGLIPALFITFLVSANSSIYNVVVKEYTNLPFNLYLVAGIILIYYFIWARTKWAFIMGVLLVSVSLWVRLLEPIWLAVVIAYWLANLKKGKIKTGLLWSGFFLLVCLLTYFSWSQFAGNIAKNPGFMNFNLVNIVDPFLGIFTGAPLPILLSVIKAWGAPFWIHLCAILALILRWKYLLNNRSLMFLGLTILISEAIYFAEFYILSFQFDWWSIVAMSLDRSSTFMLPLSAIILVELLLDSVIFKSNKKTKPVRI